MLLGEDVTVSNYFISEVSCHAHKGIVQDKWQRDTGSRTNQ